MRSSWIGRLSRHVHDGGLVLAQPPMSQSTFASRAAGKVQVIEARGLRVSKSARLCLGIGDGTLHKQ